MTEGGYMIRTFDFILKAKYNRAFMEQLEKAMSSEQSSELCTDTHRLTFYPQSKLILIAPASDSSIFHYKIVPKKMTYQAFFKILHGKWEQLDADDVADP